MNILVISDEYPPSGGGAGIVAKQLCDSLKKTPNLYFELLTLNKNNIVYKLFWLWIYRNALKKIDLSKYDKIILNDLKAIAVAGFCFNLAELRKSRIILHGSENKIVFNNPSFLTRLLYVKKYFSRTILYCDSINFVSDFLRLKFQEIELFSQNLVISKSKVAYAGIDELWLSRKLNREIIRDMSIQIRLVTVARLVKGKGIDKLIETINNASKYYDLYLDIYGDGPEFSSLNKKIMALGLSEKIKLCGKVERKRLADTFLSYDIFVLLPESQESFGLVFLEAASQGLPSISYSRFGMVESVQHKRSGYLIETTDLFVEALDYIKENYIEIREFSREFSRDFTSENFCRKIIK